MQCSIFAYMRTGLESHVLFCWRKLWRRNGRKLFTIRQGGLSAGIHASDILKTANKSISNIYQLKTGKSEKELLKLMDEETWMDSTKAKEYGFVDEIIGEGENGSLSKPLSIYNSVAMILSDETKERIRNLVKNPESEQMELEKEQENLNLLKLKGGFKNEI